MIRKNDIIEGIIIKDGFTISSGDIAIRSNTSIITPGTGTMSIDFKIDEITTNYKVVDVETKVQVSEFVKIASKNTMDERYIEVHKDSINLGGIGSGFVYAGPGGELTTSLAGGTISVISVGATGATGPGGTINQNEIAFGTGTGITSSVNLQFDPTTRSTIVGGYGNMMTNSNNSSIISGQYNFLGTSSSSSIIGGRGNNISSSYYASINGGLGNTIDNSSTYASINGGSGNSIRNSSIYSATLGGKNNDIVSSNGSSIINGGDNYIFGGSYNSINGGEYNSLLKSTNSSILGGSTNFIGTSSNSSIVDNSAIIGGSGNIITTLEDTISNSVILGGTNLSLTASNTVLVPTLKIDSVVSSTSSQFLVWGPTKNVEYVNQTDLSYLEKTYSEITTLIGSNGLIPGVMYKITDRGDLGLFHIAISNNELSKTGQRLMLCPTNYLPGIYGGIYQKGVWYPGMTASANQLAIWGGQVWKNNAGVSGTASSILALDSNWTLVDKTTFSNGEYEEKQFSIIYDFDNDWIQKQWDGYGNEVGVDNKDYAAYNLIYGAPYYIKFNPCDVTDWNLSKNLLYDSFAGFTYSAMSGNKCKFGIFNNVNLPSFSSNLMEITYNQCNFIHSNRTSVIGYNYIQGDISDNTYGFIMYNRNNGNIISNINFNSGNIIWYNINNGNIASNTTGDVSDTRVDK